MKLTIVYDNDIYRKDIDLRSDCGFACLIKTEYYTILFDTGVNEEILLRNMTILNIDPKDIKKIVISHEHKDHRGGLKSLISIIKDIDLYQLSHEHPIENIMSIIPRIPEKISEKVWTTGKIEGLVNEQSLILEGSKGWYVLTGCSHPGLEKIFQIAKQVGNIVGIIGGFHGFNNFQLVEDLHFICPCHCTAHKDDLKKVFPDEIFKCGVGKIIDLGVKV
jgi:7,8-dihydropterin-6-yl-methyl-4-(beta-D-ribofuranosyl)aminobenzene 5'-phosphate synthase